MNIHLCLNDDNGFQSGMLYAAVFETQFIRIHLSSNIIPDPGVVCRLNVLTKEVKISRWTYPFTNYRPFFGNIYWDKIAMIDRDGSSLFHRLIDLRLKNWWKFGFESYEWDDKNWTTIDECMVKAITARPEKPNATPHR